MANGIPQDETAQWDLEELWRIKLQLARDRYIKAADRLHGDLLEATGQRPDGSYAASTRRAEAKAFAEYCRILATFTELATNGKMPD